MSAVREATAADRVGTAALLARAFQDDPAMSWIYPDPAVRARRLPRLFALLFDADAAGMRLLTDGGEAATLWVAPGTPHGTGLWAMLRQLVPLARALGSGIGRGLAVSRAIDAHMPEGRFWYLHIAGCDPAHQGQGHGGRAIRAGLARAGGLPAYLETATAANVGLYRALGFEVTGEWDVPGGGPHFWSMWRVG